LCKAQFDSEVLKCSLFPGHSRAGARLSSLRVEFPRKPPKHFSFTWGSGLLISKDLAEKLHFAGLSGFSTLPIDGFAAKDRAISEDFLEFLPSWSGEFNDDPAHCKLKSYCDSCGLLLFGLQGDPYWNPTRLQSSNDFFCLAPGMDVFCSERANEFMTSACGDEFSSVPAGMAKKHNLPRTTAAMDWPPDWPAASVDQLALREKIEAADIDGVLQADASVQSRWHGK
jgi:hypothetical protein